MLVYKTT